MRFVIACLLVLGTAATAAAQGAELTPPPPERQPPATDVPPGYEGHPPGYGPPPSQQPPPPPTGVGQPPPSHPGAPPPQPPPEPEGAQHSVSLTISPFHLVLPVVEVMGEFKVQDWFGLAAILGGGSIQGTGTIADERLTVFELGAQALFYPVGDFDHGMQLGLEALFIHISGTFDSGALTGTGSGLAVGPLIGYKFAASWGLTVDIQGGYQIAGIAASASDGTTTESDSTVEGVVLLNINAGWSF